MKKIVPIRLVRLVASSFLHMKKLLASYVKNLFAKATAVVKWDFFMQLMMMVTIFILELQCYLLNMYATFHFIQLDLNFLTVLYICLNSDFCFTQNSSKKFSSIRYTYTIYKNILLLINCMYINQSYTIICQCKL